MVTLYSGTPGSGKSLYACYRIIDYLKSGRGVIANFPINEDYFKNPVSFSYIDNSKLTVSFLKQYSVSNHLPNKEDQTLIVIDEAGTFFNSRDWKSSDRLTWIKFFSQHRKLGYNVILIAQFDKMIDSQIRPCIEIEEKFRAIKNYKLAGSILSSLSGGLFCKIKFWYGARLRLGAEYFRYHKSKAIYDTFRLFD